MLVLFLRVILLYLLVFVTLRLTGKRQLSDLQPFDLVITLLIAELALEPATNTGVPLFYGVVPILTLFLLQNLVAYLSLKSEGVRKIACGQSIVVVSNGVVEEAALRSSRYTLSDLMEQLRSKDVFSLEDVAYAILETNGQLSVLLKGEKQKPTCGMLHIAASESALPLMLIQDGEVHYMALKRAGYNEAWLKKQLEKAGVFSERDVFFAFLGGDGMLHIQRRRARGGDVVFLDTKSGGKDGKA
ncbi:MAG: DUF421 domain-containing protein [Clostridiales bacterium]|nr:DUF421 domain-containing protein [Clostridiales bacterium]